MTSGERLTETRSPIGSLRHRSQDMEEMDIDHVVDVLDTPDRLANKHINGMNLENSSSVVDCPRSSEFKNSRYSDQLRATIMLPRESRHSRRTHPHRRKSPITINEVKPCNEVSTISSLERNPSSSHPPLLRRAVFKIPNTEASHSSEAQHKDKGKSVCVRPYEVALVAGNNNLSDVDGKKDVRISERGIPPGPLISFRAKGLKDGQVLSNGTGRCASKGKEIADSGSFNHIHSATDGRKMIDLATGSQQSVSRQMSTAPLPVTSSRVTGQKRLVRNGCISPSNIAQMAQRLPYTWESGSSDTEKSRGSSGVDIREIVAEGGKSNKVKGEGVIINSSTSRKLHGETILSSTSCLSSDGVVGSWRSSTHSRIGRQSVSDTRQEGDTEISFNRSYADRLPESDGHNRMGSNDSSIHGRDVIADRSLLHLKRRRGWHTYNNIQSSTSIPDRDSEVQYLGSSRESSSSGLSRFQKNQHLSYLGPISEIDECSTEMRNSYSQGVDVLNNVEPDAMARQMEADERLAHELQEQLYNEVPLYGGFEIDENIAWALQQEEGTVSAASSRSRPSFRRRTMSTTTTHGQHQPTMVYNPSSRRLAQVRAPSMRASHLRHDMFDWSTMARNRRRSPAASSGVGNLQFPLNMDLEMRLDLLEAMEAAVGDFNDLSMESNVSSVTASHILQFDRDFNENDYEMLSSLDDYNFLNRGCSASQISNLPESIVQTDGFDETCAICLEIPTAGETIRHLPCLHKFHKDCIDKWLGRNRSCPICKSSIS